MSDLESRHYVRFVDDSPLHSWISDERGRMVYANDASRRAIEGMTGRPFVPGVPIAELYPPEIAATYAASDRRVLETGSVVESLEPARRPDGREAKLLVRKFPLGDGLVGGIAIDITDPIDAHALIEAQLRETQKLESIGVLAGGIAHDFNNLLAGVLGNLDLVRRELPEAAVKAHESLRLAKEAASRAATLTKQLLAYAGKQRLDKRTVDLVEVVRSTIDLLGKRRRHVDLVASAAAFVHGDDAQLGQVVMSLVLNGVEALDADGDTKRVAVAVREQAIDRAFLDACVLGAERPVGRYVVLEVRDEGRGMDPETVSRAFEPFFTTKATHRGLGLASALGILRSHGGAVHVESAPDVGSTFSVLLPATEAPVATASPPEPASEVTLPTLLLVDDDRAVRHAASRLLDISGYRVLQAASGDEAIATYREKGAEIDAVVLDLRMPGMDGEETYNALKALDPGVRVVICSGFLDPDVVARLVEGGVFAFVTKPFEAAPFLDVVHSALRKR